MGCVRGRRARRMGAGALLVALPLVVGQAGVAGAAPGDLDPTFGDGDGIVTTDLGGYEDAAAVARQPDGKLVVAGRAGDDTISGGDILVARYTRSGRLDRSFGGGDGVVTTDVAGHDDRAEGVALQRDGRIVVVGAASTGEPGGGDPEQAVDFTDSVVARYTRGGQLDRSFGGGDGIVVTDLSESGDGASDVAVLPGGGILTSGTSGAGPVMFLQYRTAVVRYDHDGALDPAFGTDGVAVLDQLVQNTTDVALATQRDGKALVAAETDAVSPGLPGRSLAAARLLPDGGLDTGFGGGDGVAEAPVVTGDWQYADTHDVLVQPDGTVLVAGLMALSLSPPDTSFALARFTPDGALDPGFDGDGMVRTVMDGFGEAAAVALARQRDGKVVVAGSALAAGIPAWRHALARYDPDGSLDATFDGDGRLTTPAIGVSSPTSDVLVQPDGRIVTAGGAGPSLEESDVAVARFEGARRPAGAERS